MKYACSGCGLAVIVFEGKDPIKACSCDATIVANMEATAHGTGGVKS